MGLYFETELEAIRMEFCYWIVFAVSDDVCRSLQYCEEISVQFICSISLLEF